MFKRKQQDGNNLYSTDSIRIWKCYGDKSSTDNFFTTKNGNILIITIVAILILITTSFLLIKFNKGNGIGKIIVEYISVLGVFAFSGIVVLGKHNILRKSKTENYIFARDSYGKIFLFNYNDQTFKNYVVDLYRDNKIQDKDRAVKDLLINSENVDLSKLIEYVDNHQVIENMLKDGSSSKYGQEITKIIGIENKMNFKNVYCELKSDLEGERKIALSIPNAYCNCNELINVFKYLMSDKSYDDVMAKNNEKYKKDERKLEKSVRITLILFIVSLIVSVGLKVYSDKYKQVSVTPVSATVVSAETTPFIINRYKVIVRFNGQEYRLNNVYNLWQYQPNSKVEVCLSNDGKMYDNLKGAKTITNYSPIYFGFLIATLGFIIAFFDYRYRLKKYRKYLADIESDVI